MIEITPVCGKIYLGKQGENLARVVCFEEPAEWKKLFGEGVCELVHQRKGDDELYPVLLNIENNKVCWRVTESDTARVGEGQCELHYRVNGVVLKSKIWTTTVLPSLGDATAEPPQPEKTWVDQVLEAADDVRNATVHPPIIGENENWWLWDFEASKYIDSGISSGTNIDVDAELSKTSENPVANKVVTAELENKVDKVSGKGLSTNDFTNALKTRLENNTFDGYYDVDGYDASYTDGLYKAKNGIVIQSLASYSENSSYWGVDQYWCTGGEVYCRHLGDEGGWENDWEEISVSQNDIKGFATKKELADVIGDIETSLDNIIAMQNSLIPPTQVTPSQETGGDTE